MERNVWKQTTPKPAVDGCVSAFDFHYVPLKCSFFVWAEHTAWKQILKRFSPSLCKAHNARVGSRWALCRTKGHQLIADTNELSAIFHSAPAKVPSDSLTFESQFGGDSTDFVFRNLIPAAAADNRTKNLNTFRVSVSPQRPTADDDTSGKPLKKSWKWNFG